MAFFDLQDGVKLAIFSRDDLAHDAGVRKTPPSATEFSIGHNVRSEQEVDVVMMQAERAGATVVKPAQKTFWGGYAGYFADPDGHLWEVAVNPASLPARVRTRKIPEKSHRSPGTAHRRASYTRDRQRELVGYRERGILQVRNYATYRLRNSRRPADVAGERGVERVLKIV